MDAGSDPRSGSVDDLLEWVVGHHRVHVGGRDGEWQVVCLTMAYILGLTGCRGWPSWHLEMIPYTVAILAAVEGEYLRTGFLLYFGNG